MLEKWSLAAFAPGKRRCRVLDAPGRRPVGKQKTLLGIARIGLGKEVVAIVCPINFDIRVDKCISVLPSFETPTCVIYKFSTFVFNKVVR